MYGKVFGSIYDGTLHGHWQAIVTMKVLIVLSNDDGVIDMTAASISARTSIPVEIIEAGLTHLEQPDPYTRTPGEDGRRIVRLDEHRPWGWRLVNYAKYRALRNMEQKKESDRERMRVKREEEKKNSKNSDVAIGSRGVAEVAQAEAEVEAKAEKKKDEVGRQAPDTPDSTTRNGKPSTQQLRAEAVGILRFLNEKAGKNYQPVPANVDLIVGLLKQGATPDDMRAVIAKKCREWKGKPDVEQYLRPATLFGPKNFWAKYQGELVPAGGAQ